MKKQFFFLGSLLTFFFGYFFLYWMVPVPLVYAPELTGKVLVQGFSLAADRSIGLYLMKEVFDETYAEGMIIDQYPFAGTAMRLHNYCFVSVVRHHKKETPFLIGRSLRELLAVAESSGHEIAYAEYVMPGIAEGMVVAQFEKNQLHESKKKMACLISSAKKGAFLMPSLKEKTLAQIKKQVEQYQWHFDLVYKNREDQNVSEDELVILDQRPVAEALCAEAQHLFVQCLVEKK
jgi:beta-lactam-binding protein with PASTA domain